MRREKFGFFPDSSFRFVGELQPGGTRALLALTIDDVSVNVIVKEGELGQIVVEELGVMLPGEIDGIATVQIPEIICLATYMPNWRAICAIDQEDGVRSTEINDKIA